METSIEALEARQTKYRGFNPYSPGRAPWHDVPLGSISAVYNR
jgi:hypothetical protein